MNLFDFNLEQLIQLKKDKRFDNIYDVDLNNINQRKKIDSIDCHFVMYTFNRKISSHNIRFMPSEEFVNDIVNSNKSIYSKIIDNSRKLFGLFLGLLITLTFLVKIVLNKQLLGIGKSLEFFQSEYDMAIGCLDSNDQWYDNSIFFRITFTVDKIKYFYKKGLINNKQMLVI
jgi:hypothetical protein